MPSYVLNTNVSADKVTQAFLADLSKLVSKVTGKPESYVTVRVNANQLQLFGGSGDPCASSTLENLGEVNTSNATKELNSFVSKSLGIPIERVCIFFYNVKGSHIGYGTSTF